MNLALIKLKTDVYIIFIYRFYDSMKWSFYNITFAASFLLSFATYSMQIACLLAYTNTRLTEFYQPYELKTNNTRENSILEENVCSNTWLLIIFESVFIIYCAILLVYYKSKIFISRFLVVAWIIEFLFIFNFQSLCFSTSTLDHTKNSQIGYFFHVLNNVCVLPIIHHLIIFGIINMLAITSLSISIFKKYLENKKINL